MTHSDCIVKMNPSQRGPSVRRSVGLTIVVLPNGFESIRALRESQKKLETLYHTLNTEAVQLGRQRRILLQTYTTLCNMRKQNQAAYLKCAAGEKESKMQYLVELNNQVNDAFNNMLIVGRTMNAKIDECERVAYLSNAATAELHAIDAQLR